MLNFPFLGKFREIAYLNQKYRILVSHCGVTLIWQKFRESNVFTTENTKELIRLDFYGRQ